MGSGITERACRNISNFLQRADLREGGKKEKRKSGEGEGKWTKRNAGQKRRWGGRKRTRSGAPGGRRAAPPGIPLLQGLLALSSFSRQAGWPGACSLDSLSFIPLRWLRSPQAVQSLGRLSSWSTSKELSGASKGQKAICKGTRVLRRREGPACQSPSPARVRKLLQPGCTSCLDSQDEVRTTDVGGQRGDHGDLEVRLPTLSSWVVLSLQYLLPLVFEHSVLCVCNETMGLKKNIYLAVLGGGGHGNPLQYSCLENPMDGGAWRTAVRWVTKNQTRTTEATRHAWLCWVLAVACGIFSCGMRTLS